MTKENIALVVSVVALVIAGLLYFGGTKSVNLFGSTSCQSTTCLTGGLRILDGVLESDGTFRIGSSGSAQTSQVGPTSCAMKADVSIAATSTGYGFCTGLTGVTSADSVFGQFASSTGLTAVTDNFAIVSAKASTTVSGAVDFTLLNLTGAAAVPSAVSRIGSSTSVLAGH